MRELDRKKAMYFFTYRDFIIEFYPDQLLNGDSILRMVCINTQVLPYCAQDLWYTEDMWLPGGARVKDARRSAMGWIDKFWIDIIALR